MHLLIYSKYMELKQNNKSVDEVGENNELLTIEQARSLLGPNSENYNDHKLKMLIENVCGLAEVMHDTIEKNLNK